MSTDEAGVDALGVDDHSGIYSADDVTIFVSSDSSRCGNHSGWNGQRRRKPGIGRKHAAA